MKNKKETFRDFDLHRFIFLNDGPEGQDQQNQNPEAQNANPEFAETPHVDRKQAIEAADRTKQAGTLVAKEAAKDPEGNYPDLKDPEDLPDLNEVPEEKVPKASSVETLEPAERQRATPDQVIDSFYNDRDLRVALTEFMAPKKDGVNISKEDFGKLLKIHPQLSQVLNSVTLDEKGELNLDENGRKDLAKDLEKKLGIEGMHLPSKQEMKLIGEVKIGNKTVQELYGVEVVQMLSMKYETRIEKKGAALEFKVGEAWFALNAESIGTLLPSDVANAHEKRKETGGEEAYKKLVETKLKGIQSAMQLREVLAPEKQAEGGMKNLLARLRSYLQLWKAFNDSLKTGNFDTFTDIMADLKAGKDSGESRLAAQKEYETKITDINDPRVLVRMHVNPREGKAAQLFGTNNGVRYRDELKTVIEKKMAQNMGVKPEAMTEVSDQNGSMKFRVQKNGENFEVDLNSGEAFTKAMVSKIELDAAGKEIKKSLGEKNITQLSGASENSLENLLTFAPQTPAEVAQVVPNPTTEKTETSKA